MANATLDWSAMDNLTFSLQAELRSERYRDWDSVLDRPLYFKNYELLNLGIRYDATEHLTFFGRINNLLDKDFTSYTTDYIDLDGDGIYTYVTGRGAVSEVIFTDDYNVKDPARNFWVSVQLTF